jgi:ChAPs (Chs5p-Arf1p-binding proteins)
MKLWLPVLLWISVLVSSSWAQTPTLNIADSSTSPSTQKVFFQAVGDLQFHVWVDNRLIGVTPFHAQLAPGPCHLIACAEGVQPVFQPYEITEQSGQVVQIPSIPLSKENYFTLKKIILNRLQLDGNQPGMVIAALYLTTQQEERKFLIEKLDELTDQSSVKESFRARYLLDEERTQDALKTADLAISLEPNSSFPWRTMSIVQTQLGNYTEALRAANQAVLIEPAAWRNLRIRAVAYSKMQEYNAAKNDVQRADELYKRFYTKATEGQQ